MTITFYRSLSEPNVVDKSLTTVLTVMGSLREGTSVLSPTILVNTEMESIVWANYMYVAEWGRYYFINNIESVRTNLWAFSCHVDVLSTYKSQLRSLSAVIARQENEYNLYLDDDRLLTESKRQVISRAFPNRVATGGTSFVMLMAGLRPDSSS